MGKRKSPMKNNEKVVANGKSGETYNYTLGELKNLFMMKKLPEPIVSIYSTRLKVNFFIDYKYTKGFKYERLGV
jgi:hypothetical protein